MFLVVGSYGWGKGLTLDEAMKNCRRYSRDRLRDRPRLGKVQVYRCHPDTTVTELNIGFPLHDYPVEIDPKTGIQLPTQALRCKNAKEIRL